MMIARFLALVLAVLAARADAPRQDPPESPRIAALAEAVRSGGRMDAAIEAFRAELRRTGTPLVEPVLEDPSSVLLTFVWLADRPRRNVVVQSWLESRSVEKRAMRQLGDTGVWYRTFRAPADLAMGYLISPDDPRLTPGESTDDTADGWVADPLNPRRARGALGIDWSVANPSGRELAPWISGPGPSVPPDRLLDLSIDSEALGTEIPLRVYLPAGFDADAGRTYPLLLFFDGYGFFEIDRAHLLIERLTAAGDLRPAVVAFIYNPDATRNRDMSCYEPTHQFLSNELIPLMRDRFGAGLTAGETIVAGRSRSGLGAVCAAYEMPGLIGNAISQSGSFWWAPDGEELEWLARDMARTEPRPITLYLDAGLLEDGPNPDMGLSMLTVTRHLRDVARARGYEVHYEEFAGGHDPIGWRTTLPGALRAFLGR